jgi:hypothetical protein
MVASKNRILEMKYVPEKVCLMRLQAKQAPVKAQVTLRLGL